MCPDCKGVGQIVLLNRVVECKCRSSGGLMGRVDAHKEIGKLRDRLARTLGHCQDKDEMDEELFKALAQAYWVGWHDARLGGG